MKLEEYVSAPASKHAESLRRLKLLETMDLDDKITVMAALQIVAAVYVALSSRPVESGAGRQCITDALGNKQYMVELHDQLQVLEKTG